MAAVNDPSCPCGEDHGKLICTGCDSIKYCSLECQEADWLSHKLLCKTFKDFKKRPHPDMRRVIVFPPDEKKPRFRWCKVEQMSVYQTVDFEDFMGDYTCYSEAVKHHAFTLKPLKYTLNIRCDDNFIAKYAKENEGITKATGGRLSWRWRGPVLVECGTSRPDHMQDSMDIIQVRDADTRTFADVVAFFIDYWNHTPENVARKTVLKIGAVRSNCVGEQRRHEVAPFVEVQVPTLHPIFDSKYALSPISAKVGMPLLTMRYNDNRKLQSSEIGYIVNQAITFMHCEPDPNAECDLAKDKPSFGFAPSSWQDSVGNVLVARKDRKPLTANIAAAFAAYCQHHLPQYFQWQGELEHGLGGGSYKQATLGEITPGKWARYLRQWRQEKKKRAQQHQEKSDGAGDIVLPVGRMALTAREGAKLSNRLFGHTDIEVQKWSLSLNSDELVGASLDGDPDELGPGCIDSEDGEDSEAEC